MNRNENHQPDDLLERAIHAVQQIPVPEPPGETLDRAILEQTSLKPTQSTNRRFPMGRWMKYAAAAAIALVAFASLTLLTGRFDSQAAFAQMVEQVRAIEAVAFTLTADVNGNKITTRTILKEPGWMRQESEGVVTILDFSTMTSLTLDEQGKWATVIDMTSEISPDDRIPLDGFVTNYLTHLRELDPEDAAYQRDERLNGLVTHVYSIEGKAEGDEANSLTLKGLIWIDAETRLPVQMKYTMVMKTLDGLLGQISTDALIGDFDWNPDIDQAMFSLEIPEGYQVLPTTVSEASSEADFIMMLRVWAALSDDSLPDPSNPESITLITQHWENPDLTPEQNRERRTKRLTPLLGAEALAGDEMQAMNHVFEIVQKGLLLPIMMKHGDTNWRWVGDGVKPGDAIKPLCWWKPQGSDTYRVVYSDFSVRDVAPDQLPQVP